MHPFMHSLIEVILNVDKVPSPMLDDIRKYKGGKCQKKVLARSNQKLQWATGDVPSPVFLLLRDSE